LFYFLLLLVIYAVSQASLYALVSFSRGDIQKVEILTQNAANEFENDAAVVIPEKMHVLFTPCRNLELPDAEIFQYTDIVEEINDWCTNQNSIVCMAYEFHKENFYTSCRGLTINPDKAYYFPAEAESRTVLIEDINATTVKLNMQ